LSPKFRSHWIFSESKTELEGSNALSSGVPVKTAGEVGFPILASKYITISLVKGAEAE
jgi:hypothetical protein